MRQSVSFVAHKQCCSSLHITEREITPILTGLDKRRKILDVSVVVVRNGGVKCFSKIQVAGSYLELG